MRKLMLLGLVGVSGAIGLLLSVLFGVSAAPPVDSAAPVWTVRVTDSHGLAAGDAVEENGSRIGQVVRVSDVFGSTEKDVVMTLAALFEDRLCERSAFFVQAARPQGSARPVLRLVVFDDTSPLIPPGSQIAAAKSETEVEVRRQMQLMESAVQGLAKQLQTFGHALDQTTRSAEKKRLEDRIVSLFERFKESEDEIVDTLTKELERWKELLDRLAPEKPAKKSMP